MSRATLGNTGIGGTISPSGGAKFGNIWHATATGLIDGVWIYCSNTAGSSGGFVPVIYNASSASVPTSLLASGSAVTLTAGQAAGWIFCPITATLTSGNFYLLGVDVNPANASSSTVNLFLTTSPITGTDGNNYFATNSATYPTPDSTFGGAGSSNATDIFSIYAEYALASVTDAAAGVDSLSVKALVTLTDSGTASEAFTSGNGNTNLADTASGADSLGVRVLVSLTDTGSASDSLAGGSAPISLTDTGTATDSLTVKATVPLTDTGSGADHFVGGPPPSVPPVTKVEIAFVSNPYGTLTWTDVTDHVDLTAGISWNRGRQAELDQNQAGTATFTLNNPDGRFDPTNTSSPYYPFVSSNRPVRITATQAGTTYPLFYGFVEDWPQLWQIGKWGVVQITAVDAFKTILGYSPGDPYDVKVEKDYAVYSGLPGAGSTHWMFQAFDGTGPYVEQGAAAVAQSAGTTTKASPSPCRSAAVFAGADSIPCSAFGPMGEAWFNGTALPSAEGKVQVLYNAAQAANAALSSPPSDDLWPDPFVAGAGPGVFLWKPYKNVLPSDNDALGAHSTSVSGWTASGGTISHGAGGFMVLNGPSAVVLNTHFAVTAGWRYGISGKFIASSYGSGIGVTATINFYNSSGGLISSIFFGTTTLFTAGTISTTSPALAPTGAVTATITLNPTAHVGDTISQLLVISDSGRGGSYVTLTRETLWEPSQGNAASVVVILPVSGAGGTNAYVYPIPTGNAWHMVAWAAGGYTGGTDLVVIDGVSKSVASPTYDPFLTAAVLDGDLGTYFVGELAAVYLAAPDTGVINVTAASAAHHYEYGTGPGGMPRTSDFPAELTGSRVNDVLTAVGWPLAQRDIDAGLSMMVASGDVSGSTGVALIQDAADAEFGNVFMAAAGKPTFRDRSKRNSSTSQATFGELVTSGEIAYMGDLQLSQSQEKIVNNVSITQAQAAPPFTYFAADLVSQNGDSTHPAFGARSVSKTVSLADQADVQGMGDTYIARYKDEHPQVPTISFDLQTHPEFGAVILARELNDCVTVKRRPPGAPALSIGSFVDGIKGTVNGTTFRIDFQLTPQYADSTY
jgi:hypothetical protein